MVSKSCQNTGGGEGGGEVLLSSHNQSPQINSESYFPIVLSKEHTLVTFQQFLTETLSL